METEAIGRRRRGRPKTTGASDRAEEIRREQIRSAQRTYRLRKDGKTRALEAAHEELTAKHDLMEKSLFAICQEAMNSNFLTWQYETTLATMIRQSRSQFFNDQLLASPNTYSFLESSFARQLQRRSLELAYQIFDNVGSDPQVVYRTFRLVPCFKDKEKMKPYFQRLLQAGAEQPLEMYGLPFYCIGQAGQHYLRTNNATIAETPTNSRLPKRLLGIGPCEEEAYAERLAQLGYGGVWFDSYEVECYLRQRGIDPQPRSSILPVRREQESALVNTRMSIDIGCFLERISKGCSILGRAPGFRKDLIDVAINEALRFN